MANWLNFEKIQEWEYICIPGFQYNSINDEQISRALSDFENLKYVRPDIDWEDDSWLASNKTIDTTQKHAYRVATLVSTFRSGDLMQHGISLDTFSNMQCCSCVSNGHHRIRALQYLGLDCGPFWMMGLVDELQALLRLAEVKPPAEAVKYCTPELLVVQPDELTVL
jgi:hypothetical protein